MKLHQVLGCVALLCETASSWAQVPVQKPVLVPVPNAPQRTLITCWYNPQGRYTGADTAGPGVAVGKPLKTGQGGDYYWAYTIEAADGRACPRKLPD